MDLNIACRSKNNTFGQIVYFCTRLTIRKLRYSRSTIKNHKGFIAQFDAYCNARRRQPDFEEIDLRFYDDFVAFFTDKNYSLNTIGHQVKELKIIMRAAREEGFHANNIIDNRKFRVLTAEVENIYLTETELKALEMLDLRGDRSREIARDEVLDILAKYGNQLPKSYEQKVNKHIKEIAREAGIIEPIEIGYVENGEKKRRMVEKCDLVKTHTARRSGATNMYLAGIPSIAIMKITGHKTEKEFMKYLKISEEETAIELMNHPYFSRK